MSDYKVYHRTAKRIVNKENIYSVKQDGHYVFKYSTTSGIYFIPISFIPLKYAKYIYWLALTILLCIGVNVLYKLIDNKYKIGANKNSIIILSIIAVIAHIFRELHLGQVNMLLLVMYITLIYFLQQKSKILFALMLSISVFLKPFGLIFFPYLLIKKEYKIILTSLIFIFILALLPLLFYPNWHDFSNLYFDWINELKVELNKKQALLADGNHTVFSVFARYTPLKFILVNQIIEKVYQALVLIIIGAGLFIEFRKKNHNSDIVYQMILLISIIPLLAFTTYNLFIFELPIILYLIYFFKDLNITQKIMVVIGCILIGGNIHEITGSALRDYLIGISVYTFGTISLITALILFKNAKLD
ncbi:MAG: DUF2029 domain-containing protein [Lentimicrobiaceae bacterium]|nr:DUF2029 domain-containing protein [Lentimicrobiaceae bacterium]MDG1901794.1 glycosyltransferase 87 family protein [Bacteroidales bacterium]MBT3453987.1 DUF2029 domain-containing protein [Lentimicrobiaceae bacterium]MBT3819105.1 DUF2029 domain-containing protein [Lentimicrobiaceae bacterium]MBT4060533.1 DUF2029 domain-containing protein [Lentimicrobiaceae bacterium]